MRGVGLPTIFVWVPLALLSAFAGATLVAVAAAIAPSEDPAYGLLGRRLLLQGFVSCLVIGVGGTMLPQLTRGEARAVAAPSPAARARQAIAALLFLASFPIEIYAGVRPGYALRAAVAGGVVAAAARLWRPPSAPGLHRKLIWLAAWLLPLGYAAVAAVPRLRTAMLHVVFIGSFALMTLSVSLHVALSHGGRSNRLAGWTWQVLVMGLLLLAALVFRLLVGVDGEHLTWWLGSAALSFLLATVAWSALVLPAILATGPGAR